MIDSCFSLHWMTRKSWNQDVRNFLRISEFDPSTSYCKSVFRMFWILVTPGRQFPWPEMTGRWFRWTFLESGNYLLLVGHATLVTIVEHKSDCIAWLTAPSQVGCEHRIIISPYGMDLIAFQGQVGFSCTLLASVNILFDSCIEIARTSIAQGQEGSAFLVETY